MHRDSIVKSCDSKFIFYFFYWKMVQRCRSSRIPQSLLNSINYQRRLGIPNTADSTPEICAETIKSNVTVQAVEKIFFFKKVLKFHRKLYRITILLRVAIPTESASRYHDIIVSYQPVPGDCNPWM